eukprot:SAG31_NODE_593_length_13721_cov_5.192175_2_plen_209_part_00
MQGWLQNNYADVNKQKPDVIAEITRQHEAGAMLPFRRREFEVNALLRELLRRSGAPWGNHLPTNGAVLCGLSKQRRVRILGGRALQDSLVADLNWGLQLLSPSVECVLNLASATHIVCLLSHDTLSEATGCIAELNHAIRQGRQILYVYSVAHGWDFGAFYAGPDNVVKADIARREAQVYRPRDPTKRCGGYEFEAMTMELLRKMSRR